MSESQILVLFNGDDGIVCFAVKECLMFGEMDGWIKCCSKYLDASFCKQKLEDEESQISHFLCHEHPSSAFHTEIA